MRTDTPLLFFDYVDPLSYLLELELSALLPELGGGGFRRVPLEVRPPPEPMLDPAGEGWTNRWAAARVLAADQLVRLHDPVMVPWTRKAHELALHASSKGLGEEAHAALFAASILKGRDIGRVDVLVEIARGLDLNPTETKAVLDVDRYAQEVSALGDQARAMGIDTPPCLAFEGATLEGFHNRDTLRTFLCSR